MYGNVENVYNQTSLTYYIVTVSIHAFECNQRPSKESSDMLDSVLEKSCCTMIVWPLFPLAICFILYMAVGKSYDVWAFPTLLVPSLPKILQWMLGNVTGCNDVTQRPVSYNTLLYCSFICCIVLLFSMTVRCFTMLL